MTNHRTPKPPPLDMGPIGLDGLTAREIVKQSQACHPDWDVRLHCMYLMAEEDINLEELAGLGDRSPHDTITRWLNSPLPSRRDLAR